VGEGGWPPPGVTRKKNPRHSWGAGEGKRKVDEMTAKWGLVLGLLAAFAVVTVSQAAERELVKVDCNPSTDTFEISNANKGEKLSKINDPPHKNGIYNLYELITYGEDGFVKNQKSIKKTCRLSMGSILAKIDTYLYNANVQGMCGADPPSLELSLSTGKKVLLKELVFDEYCGLSEKEMIINSVLLKGKSGEVTISAIWGTEPIKKVFSVSHRTPITRAEIFSYPWIEAHKRALPKFKESNDPHLAIELLEESGIKDNWDKRPSDMKGSIYVSVLNDYGFFLSETNDRYKDALPILEKVIELDPKRHVAYLNLGDVYAKSLKETSDSTKQMELKQLVFKNYQEYARLVKEKGIKGELPQRVREALEAAKSQ